MEKLWNSFKKHVGTMIVCIISFHLGVFATVFVHYFVNFSNKISLSLDIGTLFSVIVSVLLAIFVTLNLTKTREEDRYVIDLSIKRLEKLEDLIVRKVKKIADKPSVEYAIGVTSNMRDRVSREISMLKENNLITECDSVTNLASCMEQLQQLFSGDDPRVKFNPDTSEFIIDGVAKEAMFEILSDIHDIVYKVQIIVNKQ
jgi:hypothetical protein